MKRTGIVEGSVKPHMLRLVYGDPVETGPFAVTIC